LELLTYQTPGTLAALAKVLSDVSGVTGQAILKAILAGERDPHKVGCVTGSSGEGK